MVVGTKLKTKSFRDVNLKQTEKVDALVGLLEDLDLLPELPAAERLERLGAEMVRCTQQIFKPRSKSQKQGWSPAVRAHDILRRSILKIKRHIAGEHHYSHWTPLTFRAGMTIILRDWLRDVTRLEAGLKKGGEDPDFLNPPDFAFGHSFWTSATYVSTLLCVQDAYEASLKLLQGRRRSDSRLEFSHFMRQLELDRRSGQLRTGINVTLGKTSFAGFSLDALTDQGVTHTTPEVVHEKVTGSFTTWFKAGDSDSTASLSHPQAHWSQLDESWEDFQARYAERNFPTVPLRRVCDAIQLRKVPRGSFTAAGLCPTLVEFLAAIKHSKKNSAPGVSGLSYNMLRLCPPPLLQAMYDSLATMWTSKEVPEYWKWRWLVPIPKCKSPSLKDLRPLSLVEVIRKIWAVVVVRRIGLCWSDHKVLNRCQHGFIRGVCIDEAVLEVLNTLETACEAKSDLFMSSWDIRRAFDRVPKQLLIFAWIRLGIPVDVAEYLVSIDSNGHTVVRTPLAQHAYNEGGTAALLDLSFLAELGAGQGTVDAPTNWNAVYDILLDALDSVPSDLSFQTHDGQLADSEDDALADDLISVCGSWQALQDKADVVSCFCIIAGMEIAAEKLRTFHIRWGNPSLAGKNYILLHSGNWVPTEVPLASDGWMKHLGIPWDMNTACSTMYQQILEIRLDRALSRLSFFPCSKEVKLNAIEKSLFPALLYQLKFASWPLSAYETLDQHISVTLKKIFGLNNLFPTDLLYMGREQGGMGCKKLSDLAQAAKLSLVQ